MKYLILSTKPWNVKLADDLNKYFEEKHQFDLVDNKSNFDANFCRLIKQGHYDTIFVVHWGYKISKEIYKNHRTVIFHTGHLRGGSPISNLIKRGVKSTEVHAMECVEEIDGGEIYISGEVSLLGSGEEIFMRINDVVLELIILLTEGNYYNRLEHYNYKLQNKPVMKRRKPFESTIKGISDIYQLFDHIRMLDVKTYPVSFLETDNFRFEFTRASLRMDGIYADVKITEK